MKVLEEIKEKCCLHCEAECDGCWLKELISDYTKQVRKEVCEEIRKQLKNMDFIANDTEFGEQFSCYSKYKVLDILLRVEKNQAKGRKQ